MKTSRVYTLAELADITGGELHGPPDLKIHGVSGFENPHPLHILYVGDLKKSNQAKGLPGAALLAGESPPGNDRPCIVVKNSKLAFAKMLSLFYPLARKSPGIHPTAVVDKTARIGNRVYVGPLAVVEAGAKIGDDVEIGPFALIGENAEIGEGTRIDSHACVSSGTKVGKRCLIFAGAILGKAGFGFAQDSNGSAVRIPQNGIVVIEDEVEIGAHSTIDRATLGETRIGRCTKIDNHVQIAHNCVIGEDCMIAAMVGIAGSTLVGKGTVIGGKAGIGDHLIVGEKCVIAGSAGVWGNLLPGSVVSGNPARPHKEHLRSLAALGKLAKKR